jgi:hypothetical protein
MNTGQMFLRAISERINTFAMNNVRINASLSFSPNTIAKTEVNEIFIKDAMMCGDKCGETQKKVRY